MELSEAELFMFDCDDCSGTPLAPPPQFLIPPPPRPPALAEFTVVPQDCNEEQLAQQQWESDVCQAMPVSGKIYPKYDKPIIKTRKILQY